MKWSFMILWLFAAGCTFNKGYASEHLLFEKIQNAIHLNNSANISDSEYEDLLSYISEGKERWIDLYPDLNNAPFLGMTFFQEGLNVSMAYALPENPAEVLKFVDENNISSVCGAPFIEPAVDEINAYYLKARAAITALSSDIRWKARCLATLNRVMAKDIAPESP